MIQRLGTFSLNFRANDIAGARDAYNAKIDSNVKIAQKQNDIVSKVAPNSVNAQIAMQGSTVAQKLNYLA